MSNDQFILAEEQLTGSEEPKSPRAQVGCLPRSRGASTVIRRQRDADASTLSCPEGMDVEPGLTNKRTYFVLDGSASDAITLEQRWVMVGNEHLQNNTFLARARPDDQNA